jgi:hypothetical protein
LIHEYPPLWPAKTDGDIPAQGIAVPSAVAGYLLAKHNHIGGKPWN